MFFWIKKLIHQKILIRFQPGIENGSRTWPDQFFLVCLTQDVEEFQAARTEMRALVQGIGDLAPVFFNIKTRPDKIGVVGGMNAPKLVKSFYFRAQFMSPAQVIFFLLSEAWLHCGGICCKNSWYSTSFSISCGPALRGG